MRAVHLWEQKKRGCAYCLDMKMQDSESDKMRTCCPFDSCPYKVLDKYETYEEYMASEDSQLLLSEFFISVARANELPRLRMSRIGKSGD